MTKQHFLAILLLLAVNASAYTQILVFTDTTYYFGDSSRIESVVDYKVESGDTLKHGKATFYYITGDLKQSGE